MSLDDICKKEGRHPLVIKFRLQQGAHENSHFNLGQCLLCNGYIHINENHYDIIEGMSLNMKVKLKGEYEIYRSK